MSENQPFVVEMDFSDTQAWGGENRPLVPPGDYHLTIVEFEQKPASTGTPLVAVVFEVQDEGEQKGAKVWGNYALTEKAKGRMKQLMVAVGASLNKIDSQEFLGASLIGTVIHTEGQARTDANGNVQPARTFANVINERAIEAAPQAAAKAPPVTKGAPVAQNTKPANGAARRA